MWEYWTGLEHSNQWAFASDDWGAEAIRNELQPDGQFLTKMFAKDGSGGFDFTGTYTLVKDSEALSYTLADKRQVDITFEETPAGAHITETFDPEQENPIEMQREGWQAFLDNFKQYVEKE